MFVAETRVSRYPMQRFRARKIEKPPSGDFDMEPLTLMETSLCDKVERVCRRSQSMKIILQRVLLYVFLHDLHHPFNIYKGIHFPISSWSGP